MKKPRSSFGKFGLNWRAYYGRFKQAHGGDPVVFKGRLLFQDGWIYSSTDYKGPEWGPPEDPKELCLLKVCYWRQRRHRVRVELEHTRDVLTELMELQRTKSVALQQSYASIDEETGKRKVHSRDLDLSDIRKGRALWLEQDLVECDARISEILGQLKEIRDGQQVAN